MQAVFCEGDNNRAAPQDFRGGTVLCFADNFALYKSIADVIAEVEPCDPQFAEQ